MWDCHLIPCWLVTGLLLLRRRCPIHTDSWCYPLAEMSHFSPVALFLVYLTVLSVFDMKKYKNTFSFLFQKCVTEECFFFERLESNNYNTYRSRKYSSWYVALKRTGQYKLGSKTGPGQKAILFLPMSAKSWLTFDTVTETLSLKRRECIQPFM